MVKRINNLILFGIIKKQFTWIIMPVMFYFSLERNAHPTMSVIECIPARSLKLVVNLSNPHGKLAALSLLFCINTGKSRHNKPLKKRNRLKMQYHPLIQIAYYMCYSNGL